VAQVVERLLYKLKAPISNPSTTKKITKQTCAGGMAQTAEYLSSKCKILSSNPSTGKNKTAQQTKTTMFVKHLAQDQRSTQEVFGEWCRHWGSSRCSWNEHKAGCHLLWKF
jgi:hypothetical protein